LPEKGALCREIPSSMMMQKPCLDAATICDRTRDARRNTKSYLVRNLGTGISAFTRSR
jgi:hypothetical protein